MRSLLLLISAFLSINAVLILRADDERYANCREAIECGDITNIFYPFWGVNRNNYCGQPGLELQCKNNILMLNMMGISYRILEFNSIARTVKVAREDYWGTICPQTFVNTILNFSLFNYTSGITNTTIYYGCSPRSEPIPGFASQMCNINNSETSASYVTDRLRYSVETLTGDCKNNVTVPILSTALAAVQSNQTTMEAALNEGFNLRLQIDNGACHICEGTRGACGYNNSNGGFLCLCKDKPYPTRCNTTNISSPSGSRDNKTNVIHLQQEESSSGLAYCDRASTRYDAACFRHSPTYISSPPGSGGNTTIGSNPSSSGGHTTNIPSPSGSGGNSTNGSNPLSAGGNITTNISSPPPSGSGGDRKQVAIGVAAGAGILVFIIVSVMCISRKRILVFFMKSRKGDEFDVEAFIRNYGSFTPKRYSYSNVKKITNSFKDQIGKGGYGTVYKGSLPDGRLVAVKVLSGTKGNGEDFINEVASIGRTSHVNIVTLCGFCYGKHKKALIYEYMPNGSLDTFIHKHQNDEIANSRLEWKTLFEIAVGIARGLEYLHRGCNTRILHFDIKPQNILLDKDFCPKIADFGLSKLCKTKESVVSMLGTRGTAGFIAPEVFSRNFGGVSHKSDVYSYGMLVLEMVGARRNLDSGISHTSEMFPHYVYKDLELDGDENMFGAVTEDEKILVRKMVLISLWCIQTIPSDRPSMSKVVEMLEGPLQSLRTAPKPFLFSPTTDAIGADIITSQQSETG